MNDKQIEQRDAKTGRFLDGHKGGPGRKLGSRYALGEAFVHDFYEEWKRSGEKVLRTISRDDPVAFAKIAALLVSKLDDHAKEVGGVTVVNVITGVRSANRE